MKSLFVVLFAILIIFSCQNDEKVTTPDSEEMALVSFTEFRCPGDLPETLYRESAEIQNNDFLNFWEYENDTLLLKFLFDCTCYSSFKDSTNIEADNLTIFLTDTSSYHARCICSYSCEFRFHVTNVSEIGLQLNVKFFGSESYETCLDTALVIGN